MSKIKRNDPCICGSGLKYKKCCGASSSGRVDLQSINIQLDQLQQRFISFATNQYQEQIDEKVNEYERSNLNQYEDVYKIGLTFWLLLHVPFIKDQTIFNIFYNRYKTELDQISTNIVSQWTSKTPSVYEVLLINKKTKRLTIEDIITKHTYDVPFNEREEFIEGSIIIGILVPYAALHNFFYGIVHLKHYDIQEISELIQTYTENDGLNENFPTFLRETLQLNSTLHDQVAQLFAEQMAEKEMDEETITRGISLWTEYCEQEQPSYQKSEPFAASLEYLVQKLYVPNTAITQSQLAKEYGVSPGTVSSNYRKLVNGLKDQHQDIAEL